MLMDTIRSALKAARAPPSVCFVHGIVHEIPRNEPDRARHLARDKAQDRGSAEVTTAVRD